jgi:tRNA modification GTPase
MTLQSVGREPLEEGVTRWVVVNKSDLLDASGRERIAAGNSDRQVIFVISAATGAGLDELIAAIAKLADDQFAPEPALVTRQRQREILSGVAAAFTGAADLAAAGSGEELVAEQLRRAVTGLGRLTGRVDVEDVLDVMFREFCIGK